MKKELKQTACLTAAIIIGFSFAQFWRGHPGAGLFLALLIPVYIAGWVSALLYHANDEDKKAHEDTPA